MNIKFFTESCQSRSSKKRFGLCDDPHLLQNPAYLDEIEGAKWIAVVENKRRYEIIFTAIDNCVEIKRTDGKMEKRCDGSLTYEKTIIFIELKQRRTVGNSWIKDAEIQLKSTISKFEETELSDNYTQKKAYICNSERPIFRAGQMERMEQFYEETGYVLRIEARIRIE
ncbi:hypothetical protein [Hugenholtzia roseola]|uniref:hypothetical protein n=1 Tax=Hugenholtzia roseola TaxID=1002 RepID=UPI000403916A|nr:hypothetical protein [Hugenholtzia roseola]